MNNPIATVLAESWLELPDGRVFLLKARCAIGRQEGNDLVLPLPALSRSHALLTAGPAGYTLTDLHSSNGTYLNRELVKRPVSLRNGDEIQLGEHMLRFRCTRHYDPGDIPAIPNATHRLDDVRPRDCWLLLADIVGYSTLNEQLGSEIALRRFQTWINGARPLLEKNGAYLNGYIGDAIFAYWPCDATVPEQVLNALQAIETYRARSPLPFRCVVHQGSVLFTKSEHGEKLTGRDVSFLFRSEKIAKRFRASAMLSSAAVYTLNLTERCTTLGTSAVDGMIGEFTFFGLPSEPSSAADI